MTRPSARSPRATTGPPPRSPCGGTCSAATSCSPRRCRPSGCARTPRSSTSCSPTRTWPPSPRSTRARPDAPGRTPTPWTGSRADSADGDRDLIGGRLRVGVDHAEPVRTGLTGLHVRRELAATDGHGHREVDPGVAGGALDLQDGTLARGVGAGEVDAFHLPDLRLRR